MAERMRKKIVGHALRWVDSARPGDTFTIWWLEPEGSVYPAKRHRLTMPTLAIPAYAAREKFATSAVTEVEGVFKRLPHNVSRTRILDSVAYIGGTSAGYWSLSIYSDLQEDSPGWDDRDVLGEDDATLLQFMLAVCPAVRHPPTEVALISWPGRPPGTLDAVSLHRRYRDLFAEFFSRWAPEATIRIESI